MEVSVSDLQLTSEHIVCCTEETLCLRCNRHLNPGSFVRKMEDGDICLNCLDMESCVFVGVNKLSTLRRTPHPDEIAAKVLRWNPKQKIWCEYGILMAPGTKPGGTGVSLALVIGIALMILAFVGIVNFPSSKPIESASLDNGIKEKVEISVAKDQVIERKTANKETEVSEPEKNPPHSMPKIAEKEMVVDKALAEENKPEHGDDSNDDGKAEENDIDVKLQRIAYFNALIEQDMGLPVNLSRFTPFSVESLRNACEESDGGGEECLLMGRVYVRALGVSKNYVEARRYYKRGCELGAGLACHFLGVLWAHGNGGLMSMQTALDYYNRGCQLNNPLACYNSGHIYKNSMEPPRYSKAAINYRKGCDLEFSLPCYSLALMYGYGIWVRQDFEEAKSLFESACRYGNRKSCILADRIRFHPNFDFESIFDD